eukprot:scaffold173163_cov22-Tisochrysis_lutea.AAC.1
MEQLRSIVAWSNSGAWLCGANCCVEQLRSTGRGETISVPISAHSPLLLHGATWTFKKEHLSLPLDGQIIVAWSNPGALRHFTNQARQSSHAQGFAPY